MGWSELAADGRTWTIPKERSKNGKAHLVHLAPAVRAILAELPRFSQANEAGEIEVSDLVFTTNGRTSVSGFSRAKERIDEEIEKLRAEAARQAGQDPPAPPSRVAGA